MRVRHTLDDIQVKKIALVNFDSFGNLHTLVGVINYSNSNGRCIIIEIFSRGEMRVLKCNPLHFFSMHGESNEEA